MPYSIHIRVVANDGDEIRFPVDSFDDALFCCYFFLGSCNKSVFIVENNIVSMSWRRDINSSSNQWFTFKKSFYLHLIDLFLYSR
jgi:hypothetical protein